MSLFHSKLSSGFPTHSEEKSKPFQWLTKICSQFPLFPDFHAVGSLNSLRLYSHHLFSEPFPDDPILNWSHLRPALTMTQLDWSSPLSNIQHSHLFTVYLPHLEHKHHDCRIFLVWFTTISPTPTAHSRHSVSNCWMTEYFTLSPKLPALVALPSHTLSTSPKRWLQEILKWVLKIRDWEN